MKVNLIKKDFIFLIIACSVLIICESLELLSLVKYQQHLIADNNFVMSQHEFNIFISTQIMRFFQSTIVPVSYAIATYFYYTKFKLGKAHIILWLILILISFIRIFFMPVLLFPISMLKIASYSIIIVINFIILHRIETLKNTKEEN